MVGLGLKTGLDIIIYLTCCVLEQRSTREEQQEEKRKKNGQEKRKTAGTSAGTSTTTSFCRGKKEKVTKENSRDEPDLRGAPTELLLLLL